MAFDKTPTTWLADWAEDGTDITVPIATFPELTAADADAATGDIRKIVFAIIEKLYQSYIATATADRPVKWTMRKTASVNSVRNVMSSQYVITVETEIGTQEVADETSSSPTATSTSTASASSSSTATASPTSTSTSTASSSGTSTSTSTGSSTTTWSISGSDTASHTQSASSTGSATASSTGTSSGSSTPTSTSTSTGSGTSTSTATGSSTATATATA